MDETTVAGSMRICIKQDGPTSSLMGIWVIWFWRTTQVIIQSREVDQHSAALVSQPLLFINPLEAKTLTHTCTAIGKIYFRSNGPSTY